MRQIRCDRCDATIKSTTDTRSVTLDVGEPSQRRIAEDLCKRCVRELEEFLRPLPKVAEDSSR